MWSTSVALLLCFVQLVPVPDPGLGLPQGCAQWALPAGPVGDVAPETGLAGGRLLDDAQLRSQLLADVPTDSHVVPPPRDYPWRPVEHGFDAVVKTVNDVVEVVGDTSTHTKQAAFGSAVGCIAVVLCGVIPALFLPADTSAALHSPGGQRRLKYLLGFAVGSLLGDVFLHILPETWSSDDCDLNTVGLCCIFGVLLCFLVEKCCAKTEECQHRIAAMMNLVANFIDNFTHGLAVAGSFLISVKFGALTTLAILLHEIPHEVSDFAILLRADFDRAAAIKAQLLTATGGVLGAVAALGAHAAVASAASVYVLAFTAGGFINIALVEILPELMEEQNPRESLKQMCCVGLGLGVMAAVNLLHV